MLQISNIYILLSKFLLLSKNIPKKGWEIGDMKVKKPLSTGEIARHCRVSTVTVFNWIKAKKIPYHMTAGGQYRVERKDLVEFMNKYGMPVTNDLLTGDLYKILICDNDKALLNVIAEYFRTDARLELQTASDGYSACIQIGSFAPDLLILDIKMSDIDGLEVCRRVREGAQSKGIEIIVITGIDSDPEMSQTLRSLGVRTVLKKPFKLEDLAKSVRKTLHVAV